MTERLLNVKGLTSHVNKNLTFDSQVYGLVGWFGVLQHTMRKSFI